jgi:hypothetical protein
MLEVQAAAVPDARYQWFRNGKPVAGATAASIKARAPGEYSVEVKNEAGTVASQTARLTVQ